MYYIIMLWPVNYEVFCRIRPKTDDVFLRRTTEHRMTKNLQKQSIGGRALTAKSQIGHQRNTRLVAGIETAYTIQMSYRTHSIIM